MGRKRNWPPPSDGCSPSNGSGNGGGIVGELRERIARLEVSLRYTQDRLAVVESEMEERLTALERTDRETLKTLVKLAPVLDTLYQLNTVRVLVIKGMHQLGILFLIYLTLTGHLSRETLGLVRELLQLLKPLGLA